MISASFTHAGGHFSHRYDLKGSWINRSAGGASGAALPDAAPILKDNDFLTPLQLPRAEALRMRTQVRDRGVHSISARFAYDGGHFSAGGGGCRDASRPGPYGLLTTARCPPPGAARWGGADRHEASLDL
jgi:hypothetical protein